jgi:hypothetical protein
VDFAAGGRSRLAEFKYQQLPGTSAWFVKSLRIQHWGQKSQEQPIAVHEYEVEAPALNKVFPDSIFNIALPKGVNLGISTKKASFRNLRSEGETMFFDLFDDAPDPRVHE